MVQNVLVTGASGYLGGDLLNAWAKSNVSGYDNLYALVRSDEHATKVKTLYGAEPVRCDLTEQGIRRLVLDKQITVVFFLIDAYWSKGQVAFIKALEELNKSLVGQEMHFVYTSGAKMFSDMAGAPINGSLFDNEPGLYELHKNQKAIKEEVQQAVQTNCSVIEAGEQHGVRVYVFFPCIVYGKGSGFGNPISIQTVDVVIAAKAAGGVHRIGRANKTWPVCHIEDNTSLYLALAKAILSGSNPDHGKNGFYLASSGSVCWDDIYHAIGKPLAKRGVIRDATVRPITDEVLQKMAKGLNVKPESVVVKIGGQCNFTAVHGFDLGWQPKYPPSHILEAMDEEVGRVLDNLSEKHLGIR